jgi:hypothetical protein
MLVQWHRTVMTSPHCHSLLIESLCGVMRMYAIQQEINNRTFVLSWWTKNSNTLKGTQTLVRLNNQLFLMILYCVYADAFQVLDRRCQADSRSNWWCTCFKLLR